MTSMPINFEIAEYEQERHIFDMWRWINARFAEMEAAGDFESTYLRQSERYIKKFKEEVLPVASFGLRFVKPCNEVFIRCLTGNQSYDATLRVEGFSPLDIKVEVTTNETDESVLARRVLAERGMVHRPARHEQEGGREGLSFEMVDLDEQCEEWVAVALDRAVSKVRSQKYDHRTAILVRVETWIPLPMECRSDLIARTRNVLGDQLFDVFGVYYLHGDHLDEVRGCRGQSGGEPPARPG